MTQGIEDFLNLPRLEDALREDGTHPYNNSEDANLDEDMEISSLLSDVEKEIERSSGTDHEEAMDKIFEETLQHARDLVSMGFNIDIPRARGIFEQANAMYGRALEAKNSKRDAQLKLMKVLLDKRKLDMEERKLLASNPDISNLSTPTETESVIIEDRNTLIEMLRKQMKEDKDKNA